MRASSLRGLAANGLALILNRAELFALELAEEKEHLIGLIFAAGILVVLFAAGIMAGFLTLLWAVPVSERIWVAGGACALFLLLGLGGYFSLRRHLRLRPRPFSVTISEVKDDIHCL